MALYVILLTLLFISPYLSVASTIAKPNCDEKCGNVSIPFPFGTKKECYLQPEFQVTCDHNFSPPQPFLRTSTIELTDISLGGQLKIMNFIARDCYNQSREVNNRPWIRLSKFFSFNNTMNRFIAVGCDTYALVQGYYRTNNTIRKLYTTGCMSMCSSINDVINGKCSGVGCCETSIPKGAYNVNVTLSSYYNYSYVTDNSNRCSYAFVIEEAAFRFSTDYLNGLHTAKKVPVVLDWAIGNKTCEDAKKKLDTYACKSNSDCHNPDGRNGYRCSCNKGYEGNPYLENGCQDVNECNDPNLNDCVKIATCDNTIGNYTCMCPQKYSGDGRENGEGCTHNSQNQIQTKLVIGVTVGLVVLLILSGWSCIGFHKRKMLMMKEKFFKENGGLILQQRLTGQEGSINNIAVTIFKAEELKKATNDYDDDRVLGEGGYGTVYKGYLTNNTIVAIKKSKSIDRNQIEQFINEVIVLSQINHRNVVKLLGCCLETEVPLLVYEFIDNGTLSEHLHDKVESTTTLSWDIRLRIATETAYVLSYLHSAANPPIIHRDIKSVNILLDKNHTAKVSDFGASRLVPIDQAELSTMVQGTIGYLDPEYLQTSQLTEKSDVYSFGVVLVELLTREKALSFYRPEGRRSLANHFLCSMKEDKLFDLVDESIVREENTAELKEVAELAKWCLNVKGDDRPTMKEVAVELEGITRTFRTKHSWARTDNDQDTEEMETLLGKKDGYDCSECSVQVSGFDSIQNLMVLPAAGAR